MAANMPQMGGGASRGRPGQQQLSSLVYNHLMTNPVQPTGWQSTVNIATRLATVLNM